MIQTTLRQLRYFDALARHGHFGRAAEACSISQPALSMQIKEMEETLGGVLLERSARQDTLTKFGEEIVQVIVRIERFVRGRCDDLSQVEPVIEKGVDESARLGRGEQALGLSAQNVWLAQLPFLRALPQLLIRR